MEPIEYAGYVILSLAVTAGVIFLLLFTVDSGLTARWGCRKYLFAAFAVVAIVWGIGLMLTFVGLLGGK